MRPRARQLAALAALALALTGCQDPYAHDQAQSTTAAATATAPTPGDGDRPGPPPGRIPAAAEAPSTTAHAAAMAFAERWANWDWRSAPAQQRALARLAIGDFAVELRSSAQSATADASLERDKPSSRGRVAAIDLKSAHTRAAGIVVTREQSYTAGHADLGGQHYRVYRAQLVRGSSGWGVSSWAPQP